MAAKKESYFTKLKDPRWQKKRLDILSRDNFTCTNCFDTETTLQVHHLAYAENPWDVDDSKLITLCEVCHEEFTEMNAEIKVRLSCIKDLDTLTEISRILYWAIRVDPFSLRSALNFLSMIPDLDTKTINTLLKVTFELGNQDKDS
jgi:hypothetical protein